MAAHIAQDAVAQFRLQQARLDVHHLVEGPRHMQPQGHAPRHVLPAQLFGQQPAPVRAGELNLVAVAVNLLAADGRMHRHILDQGDVLQGIAHMLLLVEQLIRIVQKLPLAAAATTAASARRRHPLGRRRQQLHHPRLGVALLFFDHLRQDPITGDGPIHEHRHPRNARDPLAAEGDLIDRQLDQLPLFNRHDMSPEASK